MSAITEQIINKLHRLEQLSEPTLNLILDFVCLVETHLTKNFNPAQDSLSVRTTETSCFDLTKDLIGISDDELPADLSTNAEHMTGYGL